MTIDHAAWIEANLRASNARYEPLRQRLVEVGLYGDTFADMIDYYKGPVSPEAVRIFLEAILTEVPDEQHGLLRSFLRLSPRFDAAPLLRLFEETDHPMVRWTVGVALGKPGARGVDPDWLIRQYRDVRNGDARIMISRAILKYAKRDQAIALMREVFDTLPPSSAYVLGRLGGEAELAFLSGKQAEHALRTLARKEIDKAIAAIERRLAKAKGR